LRGKLMALLPAKSNNNAGSSARSECGAERAGPTRPRDPSRRSGVLFALANDRKVMINVMIMVMILSFTACYRRKPTYLEGKSDA
jgi:hypothetical protein